MCAGDCVFVFHAIAGCRVDIRRRSICVRDGAEAMDYLRGEGSYANRDEYPLPALILLDLKMPKVDGFEVLTLLRAHPTLRSLPVLVLTSSDQLRDVNRAYELGANSFLV